jgi:hypothetical protein
MADLMHGIFLSNERSSLVYFGEWDWGPECLFWECDISVGRTR